MARNKIEDLRNHLFMALERLNDDDLTAEQIENEVKKAKAITSVSNAIVETAKMEINYITVTGQLESKTDLFQTNEKCLIEQL